MAKKKYDIDDLFQEQPAAAPAVDVEQKKPVEAAPQPAQPLDVGTQAPAVPAAPVERTQKKQVNKQTSKQATDEEKGSKSKRTFEINDAVWEDVETLLFVKKIKQVDFINDLLKSAVEANRELIERFKKV